MVEGLKGLFLIQLSGMPLCKDKRSHHFQQAAETVQLVDCRSHLAVEFFNFRDKTSLIFESCFLLASLYNGLFEEMEMLFEHTFVERRIIKIWRNSKVETFMHEL